LIAGTRLQAYELVSVLGQGGFGVTYLARDGQLGRQVAIKEYLPASLAIREANTTVVPRSRDVAEAFATGRDRFIDEARTLAKFGSVPSIVPVYDFLEANGTAYMVMAFAEGETLAHRLRDGGRLSPRDVDNLLLPLMDGLAHVHSAGFVHRDIKPDNIILDVQGRPTLIDFGASRTPIAGRTGAMTAIFTPGYAAVEQFTSGKQGPWTDIYGLSATLYHAISGSAPPSAFDRMLDDEFAPLSKLRPQAFSAALLSAIDAGLAVRPGDRPQSIEAWRQLVSKAGTQSGNTMVMSREGIGPAASLDGATEAMIRPLGKRPKGMLYGVVAATLVVVACAGYQLWPRATPPAPTAQSSTHNAGKAPAATLSVAASEPVRPTQISRVFDGKWSVYTVCDAFQDQPSFEHSYDAVIKDAAIYGEDGPKGETGSGILTGWVTPNGDISAIYNGTVGSDRKILVGAAAGSSLKFNLTGRVYLGIGGGNQYTLRPCAVTFIRADDPVTTPSAAANSK
jgi:hypothetical protein